MSLVGALIRGRLLRRLSPVHQVERGTDHVVVG
jgi:hypothetical protein